MAYWRQEPHDTTTSRFLDIRHYSHRGKVTISQLYDSSRRRTMEWTWKTVTLDKQDLQESPETIAMLIRVLTGWAEEVTDYGQVDSPHAKVEG